jgi:hypothetical protein
MNISCRLVSRTLNWQLPLESKSSPRRFLPGPPVGTPSLRFLQVGTPRLQPQMIPTATVSSSIHWRHFQRVGSYPEKGFRRHHGDFPQRDLWPRVVSGLSLLTRRYCQGPEQPQLQFGNLASAPDQWHNLVACFASPLSPFSFLPSLCCRQPMPSPGKHFVTRS